MLGDHPIDVVLLATDLEASKEFYAGKLGLEILNESDHLPVRREQPAGCDQEHHGHGRRADPGELAGGRSRR